MDTAQVLKAIDDAISQHTGSERELLEALDPVCEGWRMRLSELDDEENQHG